MIYLEKLLTWLSGKKSITAAILYTTNSYLWNKGIYGEIDHNFIAIILAIMFGTASIYTQRLYSAGRIKK